MTAARSATPWFREPWPWILMSGPAAVVVAALFTAFLAVRSADGVVADDYYKQGLAINRTIEKGARARLFGVEARVAFDAGRDEASVTLFSHAPAPERVRLILIHPTRAGVDQRATLVRGDDGRYVGHVAVAGTSSWLVALEDDGGNWRVGGRWYSTRHSVPLAPID
jgi:hypothetical protein